MVHKKSDLARLLRDLDFGSSIAEQDALLESARVETSVFADLFNDKVDLIPGTKGSGKSALYRIFVDFLPQTLLSRRKVVVAHGVEHRGDEVFHVFNDHFGSLDEDEFVNFWCVYLVSLANEHFLKNPEYASYLVGAEAEIKAFRTACRTARIPDFEARKSLRDVLGWVLAVMASWRPKVTHRPPGDVGEFEFDLFNRTSSEPSAPKSDRTANALPTYVQGIKQHLEGVLRKAGVSLWLMIDRLDEIFPRRSELETRALRGLLRTLRLFESPDIRVKVFLRDDILEQVASGTEGFTALTHVTARQADTLRWSEDQILTMIVKRLFAHRTLREYLDINNDRLDASREYQREAFYRVFPKAVDRGSKRSPTLRWLYNHVVDGRGVVTPRDVIDLLTKAKQFQLDEYNSDPSGSSDFIIGPTAIRYGLGELSRRKRTTFLKAEFPHLWDRIQKFIGGKAGCSEKRLREMFGRDWPKVVEDLTSIGLLRRDGKADGTRTYKIPFLYREGLEVTQGSAD